jgi:protein ImuB
MRRKNKNEKWGDMPKRFLAIWFRYLKTDWFCRRQPHLLHIPFVLSTPDHGRMVVSAANDHAQNLGIHTGTVVADARAIFPGITVIDDTPGLPGQLLHAIGEYCIRYTPCVGIDLPDGLLLDASGCAHLWGGEQAYITAIHKRFTDFGYTIRTGMADTIGAAWAMARFGKDNPVIAPGDQDEALMHLPADALRLPPKMLELLYKLGLNKTGSFINMPRSALRRRFGQELILKLDQARGFEEETIQPIQPPIPWQERLPCLEPISTRTGIEIALQRLLETICKRLQLEQKGVRTASFKCYRVDGKTEQIDIGTNRASINVRHLFKLFELKLDSIEPALGIELFILEAPKVEEAPSRQEKLWEGNCGLEDTRFSELLDRIAGKIGEGHIHRYMPDEHYWPERSFKPATTLHEKLLNSSWNADRPRPIQLLTRPALIQVTAPIPDYPPMLFRYKNKLHIIKKADGPERIEQEWWLQEGQHRDYYAVEDEDGNRYWLFRSGHYGEGHEWYMHGFFA